LGQSDYDKVYAQRQIKRAESRFRALIKKRYLNNILKDVVGPTLDFGCGAGQLLEMLPSGSLGLEVNCHLVEHLRERGLNVQLYDPSSDQLDFSGLPVGHFRTFIMSHVLEHFENADEGLRKILRACGRLRIERVIVVVPSKKGYEFDSTHRTFVNHDYLVSQGLVDCEGFAVSAIKKFPFSWKVLDDNFVFNELKVVFDKR
jgi:hypothetical protein